MHFPTAVSAFVSLFSEIAQLTCYKSSNVKSTSLSNFDMTIYGNSDVTDRKRLAAGKGVP